MNIPKGDLAVALVNFNISIEVVGVSTRIIGTSIANLHVQTQIIYNNY